MTPEELAIRHPHLYHVTEPGAWLNIKQHGLLSTSRLLDLFEIDKGSREEIEEKRRPSSMTLEHPSYGRAILNDNLPLSEKALIKCLDNDLTPTDWLRILNSRVFFWASKEGLSRFLNARHNCNRAREVLVIDTLSLARAHAECVELCPINSGSTIRKAARRGLNTFTPLLWHSFNEWRHLRGQCDKILEVVVKDHVVDIAQHTLEVFVVVGNQKTPFLEKEDRTA